LAVNVFDVPIVGPSNNVPQDDPQYTLNLYAEQVSDEVYTLKPTPGTVLDSQLSISGGGRGLITVGGRQFGVRGGFFQEKVSGSWVVRGNLTSTQGKVGMAFNLPPDGNAQIIVVDETTGYVYDFDGGAWTHLSSVSTFLGGGSQVVFCAGRAYVLIPGTTQLQCSGLYDFLTWSTSAYFTALSLNTPVTALASNGDLLYIFSSDGFEVQQNQSSSATTDPDLSVQPCRPILTGDRTGILAKYSALFSQRFCYWVGRDSEGKGVVYRHEGGGRPVRISDHSTERNIAAMEDPSDAIGWYYESVGHYFYNLSFQEGNRTLTYDNTTNLWHDRAQRDPVSGALNEIPFAAVSLHDGDVYAINYDNGKVYIVDDETFTDDGNPIVRERILTVIPAEADRFTFYQSAALFCEYGNTPVDQDDPKLMMKYSVDRGKTWSSERWQQVGGNNTYAGLVQWVGLGAAYGLALWFRVVCNQYISWRKVRMRAE
jgi:hypothetical protein